MANNAEIVWCILCGRTSLLAQWGQNNECCPFCAAASNRRYTWPRCLQINPMLPEHPELGREYRLSSRLYLANAEKEKPNG